MKRRYRLAKGCLIGLVLLLVCGCTSGGSGKPLFQDDFDDASSGWGADERQEFDRGYEAGDYFIELYESNWLAWACPGQRFDDVSVEVQVSLISGLQDGHFGVLCRHIDLDNFYYFAISADGYYAIFRRVDGGDLEPLTGDGEGMVYSSAIKTGEQSNDIRAVCQGDELSFYINGELLETVSDDSHARGDVGIGAGSGSAGGGRVQFDNFVVTKPQDGGS
ncbi:MAG: hypothetical protein DRI77_02065 [Chloroflexi bacterium]|nr:MAG: hypothetical protein DRI77_02065 [Chloroflexota bacterium]